jgi:hypothetical protein
LALVTPFGTVQVWSPPTNEKVHVVVAPVVEQTGAAAVTVGVEDGVVVDVGVEGVGVSAKLTIAAVVSVSA